MIRQSLVWKFFTRLPDLKAKCNTCSKELDIKDYNTSQLTKHLQKSKDEGHKEQCCSFVLVTLNSGLFLGSVQFPYLTIPVPFRPLNLFRYSPNLDPSLNQGCIFRVRECAQSILGKKPNLFYFRFKKRAFM
jgi:hypothetical protein